MRHARCSVGEEQVKQSGGAFSVHETHGGLWRPGNRIRATSEGVGWSSLFASAQREACFEGSFPAVRDHFLVLHLDGPVSAYFTAGKSRERRIIAPGGISLVPAGMDFGLRLETALESLHVYVRSAVLREVASEFFDGDPERVELVPRFGHRDALIEQLALGIREALTDSEPSTVYADHLARALSARLIRAHSNLAPQDAERRGGLTRTQLGRATEFMDVNLSERLSLSEIAEAAGLSPAHFIRQFKASMGLAPHKYLVRLRLERAMRLLRETDSSIAQIAFDCGFSHQEHMTRFFGRLAGTTPAVFRRTART
jgi:AraC family transcriptional regulator